MELKRRPHTPGTQVDQMSSHSLFMTLLNRLIAWQKSGLLQGLMGPLNLVLKISRYKMNFDKRDIFPFSMFDVTHDLEDDPPPVDPECVWWLGI